MPCFVWFLVVKVLLWEKANDWRFVVQLLWKLNNTFCKQNILSDDPYSWEKHLSGGYSSWKIIPQETNSSVSWHSNFLRSSVICTLPRMPCPTEKFPTAHPRPSQKIPLCFKNCTEQLKAISSTFPGLFKFHTKCKCSSLQSNLGYLLLYL